MWKPSLYSSVAGKLAQPPLPATLMPGDFPRGATDGSTTDFRWVTLASHASEKIPPGSSVCCLASTRATCVHLPTYLSQSVSDCSQPFAGRSALARGALGPCRVEPQLQWATGASKWVLGRLKKEVLRCVNT